VGCPKKPQPGPSSSRRGSKTFDHTKRTKKEDPDKAQPRIEPPAFTPPAKAEDHRIDMRENEWGAYSIVRAFGVAQKHFSRDIRPTAKDLDGDGAGEFGFLREICGVSYIQTVGGKGRAPLTDAADWRWFLARDERGKPLFWTSPPGKPDVYHEKQDGYEFLVFKSNMGVVHRINARGIADRWGYYFVFYLPGKDKAVNAGSPVPDGDPTLADARERRYAAYAWPKKPGVTGRRAFFSCGFERVWATWNLKAKYSGLTNVPPPEAGFDKAGRNPRNLEADPAIAYDPAMVKLGETVGLTPCDGEIWKIFGERKGAKRKFEKKWTREEDIADFKKDGGTKQSWWGE
jgi:hypothetical protein